MGCPKSKCEKSSKSQVSSSGDCSVQVASQVSNDESCNPVANAPTSREDNLLDIVSFKNENFVENLHGCSEKYDTILW